MDKKVQEFLASQKVGVVTVSTKEIPHSATMHFAHSDSPFQIFVMTEKNSKKCEGLLTGLSENASFVSGFSEKDWLTFQADGDIHIPRGEQEVRDAKASYYLKFPAAQANEHNPELTFLVFTPHWWRFTNLNPEPWEIISSENKK